MSALIGFVIGFLVVRVYRRITEAAHVRRMRPVWKRQGEQLCKMMDDDYVKAHSYRRA